MNQTATVQKDNSLVNKVDDVKDYIKGPILFHSNDMSYQVFADSYTDFGKLVGKISKVMGNIERIEKNGYNDFHKYEYATAEDLLDPVRKEFSKIGVTLFSSIRSIQREKIPTSRGYNTEALIGIDFMFADEKTGACMIVKYAGTGLDSGEKYLYKAYTGAIKYAIKNNLLLSTGDDPEADAPEKDHVQAQNNPTPVSPQTQMPPQYNKDNYKQQNFSRPTLIDTAKTNHTTQSTKKEPESTIDKIRELYRQNQKLVEQVAFKHLQKHEKKEDISLLQELKEKDLKDILKEIEKKMRQAG